MNPIVKIILISVAVLAVLFVILVLLAIPNMSRAKIAANESAAQASMRAIYQAQVLYESNNPSIGAACSLQALGGYATSGSPTATGAQLISPELTGGMKDGYAFQIINCRRTASGNQDRITGYQIVATPQKVGSTGNRGFCMDETGRITFDPSGGTNCSQSME
jgi:type IV pilus assembly protein PilA